MDNNELQHHGTKGMQWGKRLYQNKDGSLTALGRVRYGTKSNMAVQRRKATIAAKKKKAAADAKAAEKKKTAEEKAAEDAKKLEIQKQKWVRGRNPIDVYNNSHLYSDEELRNAYIRLNYEAQIKKLQPEKKGKVKQFIDGAIGAGKKVSDIMNTATDVKEKFDKFAKAFGLTNDTPDKSSGGKKADGKKPSSGGDDEESKVYEGEVLGEGSSKRQTGESKKKSSWTETIFTKDYSDPDITDIIESRIESSVERIFDDPARLSRGQDFIAGLLEGPR